MVYIDVDCIEMVYIDVGRGDMVYEDVDIEMPCGRISQLPPRQRAVTPGTPVSQMRARI